MRPANKVKANLSETDKKVYRQFNNAVNALLNQECGYIPSYEVAVTPLDNKKLPKSFLSQEWFVLKIKTDDNNINASWDGKYMVAVMPTLHPYIKIYTPSSEDAKSLRFLASMEYLNKDVVAIGHYVLGTNNATRKMQKSAYSPRNPEVLALFDLFTSTSMVKNAIEQKRKEKVELYQSVSTLFPRGATTLLQVREERQRNL